MISYLLSIMGEYKVYSNEETAYKAAAQYIRKNKSNLADTSKFATSLKDSFAQENYKQYCNVWNNFIEENNNYSYYKIKVTAQYMDIDF